LRNTASKIICLIVKYFLTKAVNTGQEILLIFCQETTSANVLSIFFIIPSQKFTELLILLAIAENN